MSTEETEAELLLAFEDATMHEAEPLPLYAKYGQAMALAQALEMFVVQMIGYELLSDHRRRRPHKTFDVDRILRTRLGQQLGANIHELERLTGSSPTIGHLREALELRNHLAHHFWRDRMLLTGREDGRARLHEELDHAIAWLVGLTESLIADAMVNWAALGITDEDQAMIGRHLSAAFNGDASLNPAWSIDALRRGDGA